MGRRQQREAVGREARAALDQITDRGGGTLTGLQAKAIRAWAWDLVGAAQRAEQVAAACARDAAARDQECAKLVDQVVSEELARVAAEKRAARWEAVARKMVGRTQRMRREHRAAMGVTQ